MPKTRNEISGPRGPSKKRKVDSEIDKPKKASSRLKQTESFVARTTQSKAKLSMLPTLNLDILFEIFSHLLPIDLIHLARTTKDFRRLLMQRNTTTIWKSAFAQIQELPQCPSDMSYPAWAHLAFEQVCHNCFTTNIRNISWILRTRLCNRCAKTCLENVDKFDAEKNEVDKDILECVPFDDDYCGMECCLKSDRKRFVEELEAHKHDRKDFVEQKMTEIPVRIDHAIDCEDWSESLANGRANELQQIRTDRRNAISAKLFEMGYDKELDFLTAERLEDVEHSDYIPFHKHPLVKQAKPFKDKNWDSMKDTLKDYMEIVRAYIKKKERKDLIWKRREYAALAWFDYRIVECDPGTFLPNQIDIWLWSPVKDIIEQPSEIEVTKDSFEHAFRGLPAFTNAWQTDKLEQLIRVANNNLKWLSFPEANDLERATCVFSCSNDFQHNLMGCYQEDESCIMWFPEFIYHRCNSLSRRRWGDKDETITDLDSCQSLSAESEAPGFRRRQWSTRWLFFDDKASRTVKNILTACRMPLSTKVQHLDREDPRLVCLKCSFGAKCDGERLFSIMTWRTAVQHNLKKHFGDGQTTFQRISSLDVLEVKRLEAAEPARRISALPNHPQQPIDRPWRCTLCRDRSIEKGALTLAEMRKHYTRCHGGMKAAIEEGSDYYRSYDRAPSQPYQVRMKPRDPDVDPQPGPMYIAAI
ncbi:hypothetical protein F5051DRAFT_452188 [Lentinula edodes]|nr:hypothetical protein F5051DRAFT_452188 [Lentinula edodes]